MLLCDLVVNGSAIWYGVPCLNGVGLKSQSYLNFIGQLVFLDTQGVNDPDYTGLGSRYVLLYLQDGQLNKLVPIQPTPAQQLSIILGGQSCVFSLYDKINEDISTPPVYASLYASGYYQGA